ncbi:DUF6482 family protein [Pseudomonas panipatensis]|uniref:Cation transporter n=1 Tax=Pseudomonas panipatensis TaxID=428992 RepID=A0A1G8EA48_9PSED|nr:DUF6482 family protein [Pseudomonas panipatensis]SDH66773.1 hypothetical protein SAMN05216272_102423 [Pseudomonas panipatensis]SMP37752.1 hypothetical protein SAMN06295951_10167 [Pseudomonas panipatensis]
MNLQELTNRSLAGDIDELHLVSLEGGIYVLEARIGQRFHPIQDAKGHVLGVRSVEHARELLTALPPMPFHLVHAVVHDEMCGMQDSSLPDLGVPIPLH